MEDASVHLTFLADSPVFSSFSLPSPSNIWIAVVPPTMRVDIYLTQAQDPAFTLRFATNVVKRGMSSELAPPGCTIKVPKAEIDGIFNGHLAAGGIIC